MEVEIGKQFKPKIKIELHVSSDNEGTESPYWVILDPVKNMQADLRILAQQITGPFFSRDEAEQWLNFKRYNYSKRAMVYCLSGHQSFQYKEALRCK